MAAWYNKSLFILLKRGVFLKKYHYSTAAVLLAFLASPSIVSADDQSPPAQTATNNQLVNLPQQDVLIGSGQTPTAELVSVSLPDQGNHQPSVTLVDISGQPNPNQTGTAYFDDITIDLVGHNLTDDHFLTEEGLYWSDRTQSQLIRGSEQGQLNDAATFGVQNTPTSPVTAYRINAGDSGRLTHIGKTKSGIELDLIWTVLSSDREEWLANSGYNDGRVKGLGFAGEQSIPGASGNAIVVLYNEASHLNLHYQLVKHGTTEEQPVILSFISTDIDAAQGVKTNLANLAEVIPQNANLVKTDGIIYDRTPGVVGLNGSVHLPNGGYLGAGFLSHFDYHFFSPAPERAQDSYAYPIAVRYDIFGSSLQAKLNTRLTQQIVVSYQTTTGQAIKSDEHYQGFKDHTYQVSSVPLPNHRLVRVKKDTSNQNLTKISFIYERDYTLTVTFVDENGQSLKASHQVTGPAGQPFRIEAAAINGYQSDTIHQGTITGDQTLRFVYKKVTPAQPTNPTQPSRPNQPANPVQPATPTPPNTPNQAARPTLPPSRPQLTLGGSTPSGSIRPNDLPSLAPTNSPQTVPSTPAPIPQPQWVVPPAVQAIPWQASVSRPAIRANTRLTESTQPVNFSKILPGVPSLVEREFRYHVIQKNTGLKPEEYDILVAYMNDVARMAEKKYGKKNIAKINHSVANAVAGVIYANDRSQKYVNDFNTVDYESSKYYKKAYKIVRDSYTGNNKAKVDFAHMMMPLATTHKSSFAKEITKSLMTFPFGSKDPRTFFALNSFTGDALTNLNSKDAISDLDAWVLWSSLRETQPYLHKNFETYYSTQSSRTLALNNPNTKMTIAKHTIPALLTLGTAAIVGLTTVLPALRSTGRGSRRSDTETPRYPLFPSSNPQKNITPSGSSKKNQATNSQTPSATNYPLLPSGGSSGYLPPSKPQTKSKPQTGSSTKTTSISLARKIEPIKTTIATAITKMAPPVVAFAKTVISTVKNYFPKTKQPKKKGKK